MIATAYFTISLIFFIMRKTGHAQPFAHRLEKVGKGAHVRTRPFVEHMRQR